MANLEIRDLSISYEKRSVLHNLSLIVRPGDFLIVSGPSGAGKTSLLNAINGIIPNYQDAYLRGQVFLNGMEFSSMDIATRAKRIGSVTQNPEDQIIFDNIWDELAFPMENVDIEHETIKERVEGIIDFLSLEDVRNTPTSKLSGGQMQKLVIGASLVSKKNMLILDEPLSNLDEKSSVQVLERLKNLAQAGYIIILVEHRLNKCLDYGNVFLYLDREWRIYHSKDDFLSFYGRTRPEYKHYFKSKGSNEPLIQIENLGLVIDGKEILKDINLEIYQEDKINIVGDNGAGKTSLVNVITGLTKPTSGQIYYGFDYEDLYSTIGYIFQDPNFQLFMPTVEEEVLYKAKSEALADYIIESLDLEEVRYDHPQALSQGQKRRLAVGAILAARPEILIFDEPTVGQDPRSLGKILATIDEIYQDSPLTMITISHDADLRKNLGDRDIHIENGRIISQG